MLSKRVKLITISVAVSVIFLLVLATVLCLAAMFSAAPKLSVDGKREVTVEVFSEYSPKKAKANASYLWVDVPLEVKCEGKVDTTKTGTYTLKYSAEYMDKRVTEQQIVHVVDTKAPVINSEIYNVTIDYAGREVTPDDITVTYTATDEYDGDLTSKVQKTVKGNVCYLTVSDAAGNTAVREINIIVNDGVHPTIYMSGASTVYIPAGGSYSEPGFSAKDNKDGDLTAKVKTTTNLDTGRSGTYTITYSVTDGAGNTSKITRKIVVYGTGSAEDYDNVKPNGKTVYLTFDDGPGQYTKKLLEYLDRYDVKATFFVTNQFSGYQSLLGDIYSHGHKLAVHTYSHQIYRKENNIYASVDAYMKDFNKMQALIEKYTGTTTNILRFPGGTNNTISRNYCKGIMTTLTKQMTAQGYFYFDWNVDSYDSRANSTTSQIISETIKQISSKNNAVVLMHDIHNKTVEAVPAIIEYCLQNGYTFSVLNENSPAVRYKPQN